MQNSKITCTLIFLFGLLLNANCFCFAQNIDEEQNELQNEQIIEKDPYEFHRDDVKEFKPTKENDKPTLLKGSVSKIPEGTKLKIIFETPIDESTNVIGDEVSAKISENIVVNGDTVVPAGSTINGTISEINPARRLHKAGTVKIEFKNLSIPDGRQIPIVASVLTRSGLLKGKLTKKNALISGATLVAPVAAGLGAGLLADGSAVGATVGAVIGAVAGISLYAYQKGNMVDIKPGDEISIELTEEALIPSHDDELFNKSTGKNYEVQDEHGFCLIK